MSVNASSTLQTIAVELPGAIRVFEKLGIDYCCRGNRRLRDVCAGADLPVDQVLKSLQDAERSAAEDADDLKNWNNESLADLIAYIVTRHHGFVREQLERLEPLLTKVLAIHGDRHPELARIHHLFEGLRKDLLDHLSQEEKSLFPYVLQLEAGANGERVVPHPSFGTIEAPLQKMIREHDEAGSQLREIREASNYYLVPRDACLSYRELYQGLQALEEDLHQHIFLENYILFPRALKLELTSPSRGTDIEDLPC
ncbi:MAG: iron-sulfur cluster repair di-iron protein [Terriglobia bacterium]